MLHPYFSLADQAGIQHALGPRAERFAVEVVPECGSTNSVLMAHTPADDGRTHVLVALRQTGGRGRRGRAWESWQGTSLTFSSLWWFDPGAPVPAGLSLVVGLAVARMVESLGVEEVRLKWPNDVLIHGDKLAGILVELLPGRGPTPAAVVGIGVNLALPDHDAARHGGFAALADHLPAVPDVNEILARLLLALDDAFSEYARNGFLVLRDEWQRRNAHAGLPVVISGEGLRLEGVCAGVDQDGALLLEQADGLRRVLSGELSLRPAR